MEISHFTIDEKTAAAALSNGLPKMIKKIKRHRLIYKTITITFIAASLLCFMTALISRRILE